MEDALDIAEPGGLKQVGIHLGQDGVTGDCNGGHQ